MTHTATLHTTTHDRTQGPSTIARRLTETCDCGVLTTATSVQVLDGSDTRPSRDARAILHLAGCDPATIGVANEPEGREWSGAVTIYSEQVWVYAPCRPLTAFSAVTGATR
jgi:hypothetical protein